MFRIRDYHCLPSISRVSNAPCAEVNPRAFDILDAACSAVRRGLSSSSWDEDMLFASEKADIFLNN